MKSKKILSVISIVIFTLAANFSAPALANDWIDFIVRALGISKTPNRLKSPEDELRVGDIYIVPVHGGKSRRLTNDGNYRSPIFLSGEQGLLALKKERLVHIPLTSGEEKQLYILPQVHKLIGVDRDDPDKVLMLSWNADQALELVVLSLESGQLKTLPHNPQSQEDRSLLSHLRGENREYDNVSVYLKTESRRSMGGYLEWTDVYVKRGTDRSVNVGQCDGDNCGQPTLSLDRNQVVFIRSKQY